MDVFPNVDGFNTLTKFMKKRTLLEYSALKFVIKGKHTVSLESIINDSGISHRDDELAFLLESLVQSNKITFHHQDLFDINITSTLHLDCFIDCEPDFVNSILAKIGYENIFSFEHIKKEHIDSMVAEINEKTKIIKKELQQ